MVPGADVARRAKGRRPTPRRVTVPLVANQLRQSQRRPTVSAAIARRFCSGMVSRGSARSAPPR
jgi:hypothetical protein